MYTPSLKIRVLFVAHDSQLYGAQLALLDLLRHIDRSRFAPTLVAPKPGPFVDEVVQLGIPVKTGGVLRWVFRRRRFSFKSLLRSPWALLRTPVLIALFYGGLPLRVARLLVLMHRCHIDVVYSNTITVLDGAIAAKISRKPHIWHLHEDLGTNDEIVCLVPRKWVSKSLVPRTSSQIIVVSNALKKTIYPANCLTDNVTVIHNGIDVRQFNLHQLDGFLHLELGISNDAPLVGICGAIQESKGHDNFVKAAGIICTNFPKAHFVLIGDGAKPYIQHLNELGRVLGLEGKLHFTGWRRDVPAIFRELDIVVIASRREAFGRTVIEAMASGKPVVSTRCGGPEEVIDHGKTGFLVRTDNPTELATRIRQLLEEPVLARKIGLAGRDKAKRSFSIEYYTNNIEFAISKSFDCRLF